MTEIKIVTSACRYQNGKVRCQPQAKINSEHFKISFLVCQCKQCIEFLNLGVYGPEKPENKEFIAVVRTGWDHMVHYAFNSEKSLAEKWGSKRR